jgi:hypothetical protein
MSGQPLPVARPYRSAPAFHALSFADCGLKGGPRSSGSSSIWKSTTRNGHRALIICAFTHIHNQENEISEGFYLDLLT